MQLLKLWIHSKIYLLQNSKELQENQTYKIRSLQGKIQPQDHEKCPKKNLKFKLRKKVDKEVEHLRQVQVLLANKSLQLLKENRW